MLICLSNYPPYGISVFLRENIVSVPESVYLVRVYLNDNIRYTVFLKEDETPSELFKLPPYLLNLANLGSYDIVYIFSSGVVPYVSLRKNYLRLHLSFPLYTVKIIGLLAVLILRTVRPSIYYP